MQSNNKPIKPDRTGQASDDSLDWLLEQELDEQEETLFAVEAESDSCSELSPEEAMLAARPMSGSSGQDDVFSSLFEEEILLSSDLPLADSKSASRASEKTETLMAIDHTRAGVGAQPESVPVVSANPDILELDDDDDIGERFLVIRKEKRVAQAKAVLQEPGFDGGSDTTVSLREHSYDPVTEPTLASSHASSDSAPEEPALDVSGFEIDSAVLKELDSLDFSAQFGDATYAEESRVAAVPDEHLIPEPDEESGMAYSGQIIFDQTSTQGFADADNAEVTALFDESAAIEIAETLHGIKQVPGTSNVDEAMAMDLVKIIDPGKKTQESVETRYIESYAGGGDDESFDEFLLGGDQLLAAELDPAELDVSPLQGVTGADPSPEQDIDYHEDFRALAALETQPLAQLAPRLGAIMVALEQQVVERLAFLGRDTEAVVPQLVLIQSGQDLQDYIGQSYAPLHEVLHVLPDALLDLEPQQRDALYLRYYKPATETCENDLFLDVATTMEERPPQQSTQVEEQNPGDATADLPELEFSGADPAVAASQNSPYCEAPELPEVMFDSIDDQSVLSGNESAEDIFDAAAFGEGFGEELDLPLTDQLIPDTELDAALNALSMDDRDTHLDEALLAELNVDVGEQDKETVTDPVFDEALFDADVSDELLTSVSDNSDDIDALIDSLGAAGDADDEVCGVEVETFVEEQVLTETQVEHMSLELLATPANKAFALGWAIPADIDFHRTDETAGELFAEFLDAFIEEGASELEKLESAIEIWEGGEVGSEQLYAPVGRILHTLKGIAKGVGLHVYGTFVHNFETLLDTMPQPVKGVEHEYFRVVSAWLDAAVSGFEHIVESRADIAGALPGQAVELESAHASGELPVEPAEPEVARAAEHPVNAFVSRGVERERQRDQQLADEGAKALAAQQTVRITSEKLDHLLNLTNQAQQLGVRSSQSVARSKEAGFELEARLSSVRAHIGKIADRALLSVTATGKAPSGELDALEMDQYSELQEAANILREAVEDLNDLISLSSRQNTQVETLLKQQSGVMASLSASLQSARVIPVSRLMPGLRRIVRTVSSDLGKTVTFKVLGEVGSLDRDNYSRCQIILEHMVRNALDHGIEPPEDRLVAGKPTAGRITIDVRKDGGDYLVVLADDGRGIDPDRMREVAYDKGLDVDVDEISDEEAQRLIFQKGFSTASAVSQISGRGVGMDIVLSELQQVGGDIGIRSTVGQGTTFEIRIPSNVTVNGALHVTAGGTAYAIPLDGLIAIEQVEVCRFFDAVETGENLLLDERDCEPAYLGALCSGESLPDRGSWTQTVPVIIAGDGHRAMAIAVDDVTQALELVIRSLGPKFSNVPGLAGAATTADGSAIVALDLNALVLSTAGREVALAGEKVASDEHLLVLVVDDSRTQRMVATSQFDTVGVETITAENGMVAIDLLNTTHRLPDIILLDVEMPVKDGIQTLREIRKSSRHRHLPVIMVTSRTGAKHRAMAEEAGCNGYMGKPFNFPDLVTQINELTGHNLQLG